MAATTWLGEDKATIGKANTVPLTPNELGEPDAPVLVTVTVVLNEPCEAPVKRIEIVFETLAVE